jgi:CMP-N-acetylneuraminic acid synthetase
MKILAVIPARAGSKGIPNKNIHIINGHPLIYYSIMNALTSDVTRTCPPPVTRPLSL